MNQAWVAQTVRGSPTRDSSAGSTPAPGTCACGQPEVLGMVHTPALCCRDMPGYNPGTDARLAHISIDDDGLGTIEVVE